jgi:hypothetical protein
MTEKTTTTPKATSTKQPTNAFVAKGLPNAPTAETVLVNVPLPAELHRKLRIAAITRGLTLKAAVITAIEEWSK